MKITIHKGSHEIGGNCIQVSSGKTTILLDAGLPLSADSRPVDLSRLIVDALLVSHPHQDHFGLMATLPPGTPVYIGKLARSLIDAPQVDAPQVFLGRDRYALDFHDFKAWQPFTIGEFTITPYLVDHSATDAYAFLRAGFVPAPDGRLGNRHEHRLARDGKARRAILLKTASS